ncbi:MAG: (Na+)-NQR maturation NqrM [Natronospirillum sp.]|uniref:(Na+)-NQR maturation NqrM n=1 Tax=Natronospirillum sp. TaxID=2812955 RepID=UPI0025F5EC53|nr:(Na+)-NQR maturation NqrM [Natronospirillum sp.]MCH8552880.1 (Na+)-NQR maturation NqrM [Natronospirillum sp.]
MLTVFLLVLTLMLLLVAGMAIGVMFGRKPISGSCGGIANTGVSKGACDFCGGDPNKCDAPDDEGDPKDSKTAFYDASR